MEGQYSLRGRLRNNSISSYDRTMNENYPSRSCSIAEWFPRTNVGLNQMITGVSCVNKVFVTMKVSSDLYCCTPIFFSFVIFITKIVKNALYSSSVPPNEKMVLGR